MGNLRTTWGWALGINKRCLRSLYGIVSPIDGGIEGHECWHCVLYARWWFGACTHYPLLSNLLRCVVRFFELSSLVCQLSCVVWVQSHKHGSRGLRHAAQRQRRTCGQSNDAWRHDAPGTLCLVGGMALLRRRHTSATLWAHNFSWWTLAHVHACELWVQEWSSVLYGGTYDFVVVWGAQQRGMFYYSYQLRQRTLLTQLGACVVVALEDLIWAMTCMSCSVVGDIFNRNGCAGLRCLVPRQNEPQLGKPLLVVSLVQWRRAWCTWDVEYSCGIQKYKTLCGGCSHWQLEGLLKTKTGTFFNT